MRDDPAIGGNLVIEPIGRVESTLTDRVAAPKQGFESGPQAWLVFDVAVLEGLDGIRPGERVIVLTWLDRADRGVLRVHPRDDLANPLQGVFSTRSADRPNPVGLHEVEVVAMRASGCWCATWRHSTARRSSTSSPSSHPSAPPPSLTPSSSRAPQPYPGHRARRRRGGARPGPSRPARQ